MVRRKRYFIHPSSQLKYIALSILPALVLSIFSMTLFIASGESILDREKASILEKSAEINYIVNKTLDWLAKEKYPRDLLERTTTLLKELVSLDKLLQASYFDVVKQWAASKQALLIAVFAVLLIIGIMALIYSHRIAGALFRLKRDIEMLSEGKEIPPVRFRRYDEFKEVAESLEKLRRRLQGGQRL